MKKIFLLITFLSRLFASQASKNIIPGSNSCTLIKLDQFSSISLDAQQIERQTPASDEWSEKLTLEFNIWLDFAVRRAVISQKKIQKNRDLEMVRRNWPHHDKFDLIVRAEREKILSTTKTEVKLADSLKFNDPINLDAFDYLFTFTLPSVLPQDCCCHGLIINPANRDLFSELHKSGCLSKSFKASLAPAFNVLLSAKYRIMTLGN
jgi:hypothetical protein